MPAARCEPGLAFAAWATHATSPDASSRRSTRRTSARFAGLYSPEARTRRPGWPQESDPQTLLASFEMDFACVPDMRLSPVSTLTERPHVVTEMRITGTNTGPTVLGDFGKALLGVDVEEVPPSGRPIDLPAVFVHEVRGGLVVAERQYWGLLEFLVQTGVVGG